MYHPHPSASATLAAIRAHQGELFHQKRGGEFRYRVDRSCLVPDRSNYPIPLKQIEMALDRAPFSSTTVLQDLRGPSYIYAVLMDARIRPAWDASVMVPPQARVEPQEVSSGRPREPGIILGHVKLKWVCSIEPLRGEDGECIEFRPTAAANRLHAYGLGPFCRFTVPGQWAGATGVYAIAVDGRVRYVGQCSDLAARFNSGYGTISSANIRAGGQQTNCRINSLILQAVREHSRVSLYFMAAEQRVLLESKLIASVRPAWNR
jgi:hypothetical protein